MPASSPTIILDAGPLIAAVNRKDREHAWIMRQLVQRRSPFIVTSAAVAEATHGLNNDPVAVGLLREWVQRMTVSDPSPVDVL